MSKLNKEIRSTFADHVGERICFTCTIGKRGTTNKGASVLCLEDIVFKGEEVDHVWIEGEYSVQKGKRFCVEGEVYVYGDYSNYGVKHCLFISLN